METALSQMQTFLLSQATTKLDSKTNVGVCLLLSFIASLGLGCLSYVVENITYSTLSSFERIGILERLSPDIPSTKDKFQVRRSL